MRIIHESAHDFEAISLKRPFLQKLNKGAGARNFRNNVTHTLDQAFLAQSLSGSLEVLDVNKLFNAQLACGLFTIGTSLTVLSICKGMSSTGINDQQSKPLRFQIERNVLNTHISAIQCQRMSALATQ